MLQQTTVTVVIPYFTKFISLYPTVADLAAAPLDEVLQHWAGLGYYRRARLLHQAAQTLQHGWPLDEASWRRVPGVGAYTAAMLAALLYNHPAVVVDGTITRVLARLAALSTPLPAGKKIIYQHAARLTPPHRCGDYAQALMDLAARVCTVRNPQCRQCPLLNFCAAGQRGVGHDYPRRQVKPSKPTRYARASLCRRGEKVFITRRPDSGLLASTWALPMTQPQAKPYANHPRLLGVVQHVFTHLKLELHVCLATTPPKGSVGIWVERDVLAHKLGSSLMRKAARLMPEMPHASKNHR